MGILWRSLDDELKNQLGMAGIYTQGEIFHVTATTGQFRTWLDERVPGDRMYTTVVDAEAALTAGRNDIVLLHPDSQTLTGLVTWNTNYSHLLGTGAPTMVAQRSRIFAGSTQTVGNMLMSATGCSFRNLYFFFGSSSDTDTYNVSVTGGRSYFENVHFAGLGHATPAGRAGASNLLLNGADECTFKNCTVGLDTIKRTAANCVLRIDGGSVRNIFHDCHFSTWSETGAHAAVIIADSSAMDRYLWFKGCHFSNFYTNHVATLNQVFDDIAGNTHNIYLQDCTQHGWDAWQDDDTGSIFGNQPASNAAGGKMLEVSE